MYSHLSIHELLSHQVGNAQEIADYRNESVILSDSIIVTDQKGLIAVDFIPKDSIIFSFKNKVSCARTRTSIQVGNDVHIEAGDFGAYTNHSCEPNSFMWTCLRNEGKEAHVVLVAMRSIEIGEEIAFDYATTETSLTPHLQGISCKCKSPHCRNSIQGFYALPHQVRGELISKNMLSPHLISVFEDVKQIK